MYVCRKLSRRPRSAWRVVWFLRGSLQEFLSRKRKRKREEQQEEEEEEEREEEVMKKTKKLRRRRTVGSRYSA